MSAECDVHGTDLLGDQWSGFVCPSCERDRFKAALEQLQNGPDTLTPDGLKIVIAALYPAPPISEGSE